MDPSSELKMAPRNLTEALFKTPQKEKPLETIQPFVTDDRPSSPPPTTNHRKRGYVNTTSFYLCKDMGQGYHRNAFVYFIFCAKEDVTIGS
jgi:hypothetical protein